MAVPFILGRDAAILGSLRLRSSEPDEISSGVAPLAPEARIQALEHGTFRAGIEAWRLPALSLFTVEMRGGRAVLPSCRNYVGMTLPEVGAFEIHEAGRVRAFGPGQLLLTPSDEPMDLRMSAPSKVLAVNVASDLVTPRSERELRPGKLRSALSEDEGAVASLTHYTRWLWTELRSEQTALRVPAIAREVQATLAALIANACVPSEREPAANATAMRITEEILAENLAETITLAELAAIVGTSVRSLTRAFHTRHGLGPIAFRRRLRLEAARRALSLAQPDEESVTDVALRFGFAHLGRFAVAYRQHTGELPSETLRRPRSPRGHPRSPTS